MNQAFFEFGRWALVNLALIGFWQFIASRLVSPLREVWPASVDVERKPMADRKLHRYIITFAIVCELCLMVDSIALITSALTRYGWAQ
ncbi:MAG: hypothetical protein JWL66_956 [Sphingomonadales bacterium]|jgi:hypothetical protein|nr:hypothetical protein [Sphingomonadales bacterium]